jgi:hypothetical protein
VRRASRYPKFKTVLQPHRVGAMVNNLQRAVVLENLPGLFHSPTTFITNMSTTRRNCSSFSTTW